MLGAGRKPIGWIVAATIVAILAIAAFNWKTVGLIPALILSERRPPLLRDAQWGDASSAIAFQQRFRPGVPEQELMSWLKANNFEIALPGAASRTTDGLPCAERLNIRWSTGADGKLVRASAEVSEAGCL